MIFYASIDISVSDHFAKTGKMIDFGKCAKSGAENNVEEFLEKFCFQLTETEMKNLRSQIVTSSLKKENYRGRRYLSYAFTEQGIAMLSELLKIVLCRSIFKRFRKEVFYNLKN